MSSPHDFDFLHGEWEVANRRRTDFLDPDSGWEEFRATSRCLPDRCSARTTPIVTMFCAVNSAVGGSSRRKSASAACSASSAFDRSCATSDGSYASPASASAAR